MITTHRGSEAPRLSFRYRMHAQTSVSKNLAASVPRCVVDVQSCQHVKSVKVAAHGVVHERPRQRGSASETHRSWNVTGNSRCALTSGVRAWARAGCSTYSVLAGWTSDSSGWRAMRCRGGRLLWSWSEGDRGGTSAATTGVHSGLIPRGALFPVAECRLP